MNRLVIGKRKQNDLVRLVGRIAHIVEGETGDYIQHNFIRRRLSYISGMMPQYNNIPKSMLLKFFLLWLFEEYDSGIMLFVRGNKKSVMHSITSFNYRFDSTIYCKKQKILCSVMNSGKGIINETCSLCDITYVNKVKNNTEL